MRTGPLFSSATGKWATPAAVYEALDAEFAFTLDPCPMDDAERIMETDGLARSWRGERVFCNPPYGKGIGGWLAKAREADAAVFLLPSRTDTAWWHDYAVNADEIRFIRGRLKFGGAANGAPFPSVVLVFRAERQVQR
jgi:site-specific DNA-methyltransferase (adenine-specific)